MLETRNPRNQKTDWLTLLANGMLTTTSDKLSSTDGKTSSNLHKYMLNNNIIYSNGSIWSRYRLNQHFDKMHAVYAYIVSISILQFVFVDHQWLLLISCAIRSDTETKKYTITRLMMWSQCDDKCNIVFLVLFLFSSVSLCPLRVTPLITNNTFAQATTRTRHFNRIYDI